jgi:signal peptidase I
MLKVLKVTGESLSPAYQEGDFVVIATIPFLFGSINRGDVIVFNHKTYGTLIKKVDQINSQRDQIHIVGTHHHSVDSTHFGPIDKGDLIGKVIWHIPKPGR